MNPSIKHMWSLPGFRSAADAAKAAVKASYWHRVNLGDTDELVGGLIGSEGVMWPRLVADTVCGRLTRRSVGLVVCY